VIIDDLVALLYASLIADFSVYTSTGCSYPVVIIVFL